MAAVWIAVCFVASSTAAAQVYSYHMVRMPDGINLATHVWLPGPTGDFPVVLTRTPYPLSNPANDMTLYLQHGYAAVVQHCRGTGASQGEFWPWVDAASDGHATIEWIAQQTWCDGNVGMVGRSAMGKTQYAVAQGAPAVLKCLSPAHANPESYHNGVFQGGALRYELIYNWMTNAGLFHIYEEILKHRLWSAWWYGSNHIASLNEIHVPMLHMGRWFDINQQGTLDAFRVCQLEAGAGAAGNQYLVMDPLDHHGGHGQLQFPSADPGFDQLKIDWLDHWLKGEPTGVDDPMGVDHWRHARIYLMGAVGEPGAPGNTWIEMNDWPPLADTRPLYLTEGGGLTESIPSPGQLVLPIDPLNPVPTVGGANLYIAKGPYDQSWIEARADVHTFTTAPLTRPVYVVGPVTAKIWIRPDSLDLDLSVRLTDVYPDGRSMLVIDGIQRARMRCSDEYECFLDPGVPTEIEVDLWSTAIVFNTGHRIRVAIAGTNWQRFERNSNDGGDLNNPNYTVVYPELLFGPQYPSAILLPLSAVFADGFESGDTSAWSTTVR